jgi:hypothetical protein
VLGRSLDELPPQTRRVLSALDAWVSEHAQAQAIERSLVRFTRRSVRVVLGLSDTQLRVHLERLVTMDYVALHGGGKPGQRFSYSLLFDGDAERDAPQMMGLSDATSRGQSPTSRGATPNLAGGSRPGRGGVAVGSRPRATAGNTSSDAGLAASTLDTAQNAHHGRSVSNGSAAREARP